MTGVQRCITGMIHGEGKRCVHEVHYTGVKNLHILMMSALALSNRWCPTIVPSVCSSSRSSCVTFLGWMLN